MFYSLKQMYWGFSYQLRNSLNYFQTYVWCYLLNALGLKVYYAKKPTYPPAKQTEISKSGETYKLSISLYFGCG